MSRCRDQSKQHIILHPSSSPPPHRQSIGRPLSIHFADLVNGHALGDGDGRAGLAVHHLHVEAVGRPSHGAHATLLSGQLAADDPDSAAHIRHDGREVVLVDADDLVAHRHLADEPVDDCADDALFFVAVTDFRRLSGSWRAAAAVASARRRAVRAWAWTRRRYSAPRSAAARWAPFESKTRLPRCRRARELSPHQAGR
eukprot:Selendium_serpulae@DN9340_c0_g1_i1.p1